MLVVDKEVDQKIEIFKALCMRDNHPEYTKPSLDELINRTEEVYKKLKKSTQ